MTPLQHVRTHLIRGLLILLPTIITFWLLRILFSMISDNVTPWVVRILGALGVQGLDDWHARFVAPMIGVVLTMLVVYVIGLVAANLVGQRVLAWVEGGILKIPLVKGIYGGARQLLDAMGSGGKGGFSRVVLVEYPRKSVWTIGFVTNESPARVPVDGGGVDAVMVFFPTTPNPTSGWLALVPVDDLLEVDLTIEEGVKLIVSGGIVTPEALSSRIRRPGSGPAGA
jgi:uncharacterized membrane protein